MNKFHFSVHISFKTDYDVENLGKILKLEPYKTTKLANSLGKNKTAKFWFKTKEFEEIYTDNLFEEFVLGIKNNLKDLPQILTEFEGTCTFGIIFTRLEDKPCLSMSNEVLSTLANLGAKFDVDFI